MNSGTAWTIAHGGVHAKAHTSCAVLAAFPSPPQSKTTFDPPTSPNAEQVYGSWCQRRKRRARARCPVCPGRSGGLIAEAPGYARMSYENGSLYWHDLDKEGFTERVERRKIADKFFDLKE